MRSRRARPRTATGAARRRARSAAKELFARYGIPIPKGEPAFNLEEVGPIAERLRDATGSPVVVVKAQIHAGGRGKGGGVKVAKGGAAEATAIAEKMLGMQLVTKQ